MNREQFKEGWDQLKGRLQKQWVNLTDEDILQIAGDQDKFNGVLHVRYGESKGEVIKWANRWHAKWAGWYEGYEEAKPAS